MQVEKVDRTVTPIQRLLLAFDSGIHKMQVARLVRGLPGPVARDANNIFSLQETIETRGIDTVSFDFFDTLFFRKHLSLEQVFEKTAQLGSTLVPGDRAEALSCLYAARGYTADKLKRSMQRLGQGDEPALTEVFNRSLRGLVPDDQHRAALCTDLANLEAAIECENLVPNDHVHSVFRTLKELGRTVIITSDMYLRKDALETILRSRGLYDYVDHLLVSADFGITKNSGQLFREVIDRAGCPPERILHVGDNWNNDVVRARENGVTARHYFNHTRENDTRLLDQLATLPRSAALRKRDVATAFDVGAPGPMRSLDAIIDQVMGPACALFVHDILHKAARRQSSDLYFLTRDGTIFMQIADAMKTAAPQLYPSTARHKILASSRATGALLGVQRNDSDYLYITAEYLTEATFSFERFLELFKVPKDEIATLPQETQARIAALGDAMSLLEFRDLYWAYPGIQDLLMHHIGGQKHRNIQYLEQIGFFDAHNPILVDVGYSGTWGKQLSPVLEEREQHGQSVPHADYEFFATNRFFSGNVRQMHPSLRMRPGRVLSHQNRDFLTISLNYAWLEPFFLDPHLGKLEGFEGGETMTPKFRPSNFSEAERADIQTLRQRLVDRCARMATDLLHKEGDVSEIREVVSARLLRLIGHPRPCEVGAFNTLTHERGMKTLNRQEIALRVFPRNLQAKIYYLMEHDHWVQGTMARSGMGLLNHAIAWQYRRKQPQTVDWKP